MPGELERAPRDRAARALRLPAPAGGWRWGERGLAWSGVGRTRTEAALEALAALGASEVLQLGCAGGLRPGSRAGDAYWIEAVRCEDAERPPLALDSGQSLREALRAGGLALPAGGCVSVRAVASTAAAKGALAAAYPDAEVCDMETYWAAAAADRLGLRFGAVRVVIDGLDHELPDFSDALDELGRPRPLLFAARLARRPRLALALPALERAFGAAQARLGEVAAALLA